MRSMARRIAALLGLIVVNVAAWIWAAPDVDAVLGPVASIFRAPPMLPPAATTRIDDPTGALNGARRDLEGEIDRFGFDLGIGLRIVATAEPGDPEVRAESLLAEEPAIAWHPTGTIVVVLDPQGRRVVVARSEALAKLDPSRTAESLLAARILPFFDEPLLGVALLSGVAQLRDQLLGAAADGRLLLDDDVLARSIVARVREHEATGSARCAQPASGSGDGVEATVERFVCALGRDDPSAGGSLLTDASEVQIARRPLLAFETRARAAALDAGRPWSIVEIDDRAVVRPAVQGIPDFVPVLLVREAGVWRVDLVEMGKNFYSFSLGQCLQRNARGPYWLVLGGKPYGGEFDADLTPIELWGEPLEAAIERLEKTDGPVAKRRLAEILLRNVWLPGEAMMRWDEVMMLVQDDFAIADTFADRAEYVGYPLLGAIAIAPYGPRAQEHLASLLIHANYVDAGVRMLQQSIAWRNARDARRMALPRDRVRSI